MFGSKTKKIVKFAGIAAVAVFVVGLVNIVKPGHNSVVKTNIVKPGHIS